MLLFLLLCKLLLESNLSLSCGSEHFSLFLSLSDGNAPSDSNFLHPQPSGNDDCASPLQDFFAPDHEHSSVGCTPLFDQPQSLHLLLMRYSPAANNHHSSLALLSQPDGSFVCSNAFVSCDNGSTSSCSSSQHNDPLLTEHSLPPSVGDHLSTSGHGCPTSCHLSSSDNNQLASSFDKVCTSDGNSSFSRSNGSLSCSPVVSFPCCSGSSTGKHD